MDENKLFRSYLRKTITGINDECIELDNGADINSVYQQYQPDWILIDLFLKNENGFKLAEKLKSECPGTNIALLSDINDERLRLKAKQVGAAAFIVKENLFECYNIIHGR